jgi:Ca2+-binding RTX toxin-like protein
VGAGNDVVTVGNGDDAVAGGSGNDQVYGGNGDDLVEGAAGNDILDGENGDDTLNGGSGIDTLTGGKGADIFFFNAASESIPAAGDTITDFQHGSDLIDLSIYAGVLTFDDNATPAVDPGVTPYHVTWYESGGNRSFRPT